MAIPQRQVTGQVLDPTGAGIDGGQIDVEISTPGTVDDDTTAAVYSVVGRQTVQIDASGNVSFYLVPNDLITPANTNYRFLYKLPNGIIVVERIQIVDGVGAVYIGDLTRVDSSNSVLYKFLEATYATDPEENLPSASAVYRGVTALVKGASGQEDVLLQCMKSESDTYAWVLINAGGL